jgi:hypothetical protein
MARTLVCPDNTLLGPGLKQLASVPLAWHEHKLAFAWAKLVLLLLQSPPEGPEQPDLQPLRVLAETCSQPYQLKYAVLECSFHRSWSGDSTVVKLVVTPDLHELMLLIVRTIVLRGSSLKFGAPPKGPLERAAQTALTAHVRGT